MNSNKNISLDVLKSHLFETIEGVKNLSDEDASPCEKTSIEQAKAIVSAAGAIINIYKVQLDGIALATKMDDARRAANIVTDLGIVDEETVKKIGM